MKFRRRFFGNRERSALFMVAGGKCERCGTDLIAGWHADHTKPWSRGGKTVEGNGQALCAMCNLMKGDTQMITFESLRAWQKRFVRIFQGWTESTFLLVALPGGGKTIASLYVAKDWRDRAESRARLIVVVAPTRNVRRQWQKVAARTFGL